MLGAFASYYPKSRIMGVIDVLSQAVRPIPYYVMALVMLIMFGYVIKIFPFGGAYPPGTHVALTPQFMSDSHQAFSPAGAEFGDGRHGGLVPGHEVPDVQYHL